jgi:hypothetical protein
MEKEKKPFITIVIIILAVVFFVFFGALNNTASENLAIVRIFEPDEAAVLPYIQNMATPKGSLESFLRGFVFYQYYFYGFPFFGLSGLVALPFQWSGQLQNTPMLMLALRQVVSVLPMLLGILILVYLQDGFRTYRSIVLFLFLLIIPATLQNGLWLHPDGLVVLLSSLVLFLLVKDNRTLGKYFFISAAICGILIAAKVVGVFFFMAVGVSIIWTLVEKKVSWKKAILSSIAYILILGLFFVISNPFLLSSWARTEYLSIASKQSDLLTHGYGVLYGKGLKSLSPILHEFYGSLVFLLCSFALLISGLFNEKKRFLSALILSWLVPLTIYVFFIGHFKYQYWLPVALPLLSSWFMALPDRESWNKSKNWVNIARVFFIAVFIFQSASFLRQDINTIEKHLSRESSSQSIKFYENVRQTLGSEIDKPLNVYFDYRLYLPDDNNWQKHTSFELMTYDFVEEGSFDILLLQQQRIRDYLADGLVGVNPEEFERSQLFYRDADAGDIEGYTLVYRDSTGLIFKKMP